MPNQPLLERALYLLEAGFHIFPLGGYGETPPDYYIKERFDGDIDKARASWPKAPRISWRAFQTAPPSVETVMHWWKMWPNANIGLATGGLIVVDADSQATSDWVRSYLTPTPWRVKTGKGYHYYYRANPAIEIRNSADPLAKIDTRGMGGYVVAGGSRHSSGAYYADEIAADMGAVALCDLPMLQAADMEAIHGYRHTNMQEASAQSPKQGGNLAGFDATKWTTQADGTPVIEGGRNNAAASLAGQYLRQGLPLRDVQKLMNGWNGTNPVPLSDTELGTTIASVTLTHQRNHPDMPIQIEAAPLPIKTLSKTKNKLFPPHLLKVPGLVGEIAAYINKTSVKPQPNLALAAALVLCGTVMGRKVRTRTDLRTNLYIVAIADSGSGKEHARKAIKRLLQDCGAMHLLGAEGLASAPGLFAAFMKAPSCLLLLDEVGRFFKQVMSPKAPSYMQEIATMLMKLFGSADSAFMEPLKAEHANNAARLVQQPCVGMYGTTVPGRMFESLTIADIIDGFLPRLLTVHSDTPDPEKQQAVDKTPDAELIRTLELWIARPVNAYAAGNLDLNPNPLYVDFSPEAQQVFDEFEAANRVRKAQTRGTGLDAMWARADEHAMKLALVMACGRKFDNPVIEATDASWACELVTFLFDRSIAEIDVNVSENEHESILKKVLHFVAERGVVAKSELLRKFRSVKTDGMKSILENLQETGDVAMQLAPVDLTGKGGRPGVSVVFTGGKK